MVFTSGFSWPQAHPSSSDAASSNPLGRGLSTRECFAVNGYDPKPPSGPYPWPWSKPSTTTIAPSRGLFGGSTTVTPSFGVAPASTISFGVPPTPQSTFGQPTPSASLFGFPAATRTSSVFSFNETGEKLVAITQKPELAHKSPEEMRFEHRGGANPFASSQPPAPANLFRPSSVPAKRQPPPPVNLFGPTPLPSAGPVKWSTTDSKSLLFDDGVKPFTSVRFGGEPTKPVVSSSTQGSPIVKCTLSTNNPFARPTSSTENPFGKTTPSKSNPLANVTTENPFATSVNPFAKSTLPIASKNPFAEPQNPFTNATPSSQNPHNPFGVAPPSATHVPPSQNPFAPKESSPIGFVFMKPNGSAPSAFEKWTFAPASNSSNDNGAKSGTFDLKLEAAKEQRGESLLSQVNSCISVDRVSVPIYNMPAANPAKLPAPPTFECKSTWKPQISKSLTQSEDVESSASNATISPTMIATPDGDPYGTGKVGAGLVESTVKAVLGKEDADTADAALLALPTNTARPVQSGSRAGAFIRRGTRKYFAPASSAVVAHTPSPRKFSSGSPPSAAKHTVERIVIGRSDMEPWKRGEFRFKTSIFARSATTIPPPEPLPVVILTTDEQQETAHLATQEEQLENYDL